MLFATLTLIFASAAFWAIFRLIGEAQDDNRTGHRLEVPGLALVVAGAGVVAVQSAVGFIMGEIGVATDLAESATPVWPLCLSALLTAVVAIATLLLFAPHTLVRRLLPRDRHQLVVQTAAALLGYVLVRLASESCHELAVTIAKWVGYKGPLGHPVLEGLSHISEPFQKWALVIAVCVVTPIAEELLFRVTLLGWLLRHMTPGGAILVSGVVFALFHFPLVTAPAMFVFGLLQGWAYVRTGNLYVPVLIHIFFNTHSILVVTLASG